MVNREFILKFSGCRLDQTIFKDTNEKDRQTTDLSLYEDKCATKRYKDARKYQATEQSKQITLAVNSALRNDLRFR